jgi:hypothetical protein
MKRPAWSTPLPQPITIPDIITLKTLADVRKMFGQIPKERRQLSTRRHIVQTRRGAMLPIGSTMPPAART